MVSASLIQEENQMKSVRIMALIIMFACIIAVAGKTQAEELNVRQPSQNEIGTPATCPVTKASFKVSKETPVIDYKGKSYFFCCDGCIGDFKKDPEKFAK
jgi:YHS domain-containing protein